MVADHDKLGRTALWRFGQLQDWAGLVTDAAVDRSLVASLQKSGIRVIKALAKETRLRRPRSNSPPA